MRHRPILRVLGFLYIAVGSAMLLPALFSLLETSDVLVPFLTSAAVPISLGGAAAFYTRGTRADLRIRDGFAVVAFGWIGASLFGALPYLFSGVCPNFVLAVFESTSGFTTTGATIFQQVEALPRAILLWRHLTQWIGGMGIVLLSVAILPMLGAGGMQIFKVDVPGPASDRLAPRIRSTARILWGIYLGMTVLLVGLLLLGGLRPLDAVCHAFSTVSTGGFSSRDGNIGSYGSLFIESVILVFMFAAGANFSLHYWLVRGKWHRYWKNEEFRFYASLVLVTSAILFLELWTRPDPVVGGSLHHAGFQAVSILSGTGFATQDYAFWGFGTQLMLFALMFIGGCAGSTAGGLKMMRVLVLAKHGLRELRKSIHPRGVFNVRLGGIRVPDDALVNILGFFLLYQAVFAATSMALAIMGVDPVTALGASVASLGNLGPGLGAVGPQGSYVGLPAVGQILLCVCMLLGRLELFSVLVLLTPMFWRRG